MNLEFALAPAGLVCLAVPATWLCGTKMRARLNRPVRRFSEGIGPLAGSWMNWVDLARGAGGAWLVQDALQPTISSGEELATTFLGIELGALFLCVLLQTVWIRRPVRILGPFFFLAGVSLVLSGPLTGSFALIVGLCCALMIGRLSSVFWFVSLGLVGFAALFHKFDLYSAFSAFVFVIPSMLAFRFNTRISFMRRPEADPAEARAVELARAQQARAKALRKGDPILKKAEPVLKRPETAVKAPLVKAETPRPQPVKVEALKSQMKAEPVRAEPARAEAARELGNVIQTDFAASAAKAAVLAPAPVATAPAKAARRPVGERTPIPDFLRIAEDPKPAHRKIRIRIRRGA